MLRNCAPVRRLPRPPSGPLTLRQSRDRGTDPKPKALAVSWLSSVVTTISAVVGLALTFRPTFTKWQVKDAAGMFDGHFIKNYNSLTMFFETMLFIYHSDEQDSNAMCCIFTYVCVCVCVWCRVVSCYLLIYTRSLSLKKCWYHGETQHKTLLNGC